MFHSSVHSLKQFPVLHQIIDQGEREENASLNSTSITMNSTKDNLLDVSITSNPTIDEKSAIENSMLTDVAYTNSRPLSPPHDLPPPPPDLAKPTTSSSSVLSHAASESQHQLISGTPASKSSINNGSTSSQSLLSQGTQKPQPSSSTSSYSGKTSTPKLARSVDIPCTSTAFWIIAISPMSAFVNKKSGLDL
ncbi:hypothetical protein ANCCEY_01742 [Ancylostoma ceylanicum]|uniref:Uncharacterized protein n=1 Tax=Ancylostoma ceylanicum TaxID=53326 RepID=A0A0D6M504_9BILA|nr:hypothetical protein ANCCEY_01742 [Ancylostoma ceylanicum]